MTPALRQLVKELRAIPLKTTQEAADALEQSTEAEELLERLEEWYPNLVEAARMSLKRSNKRAAA